jgi:hypothetical protein
VFSRGEMKEHSICQSIYLLSLPPITLYLSLSSDLFFFFSDQITSYFVISLPWQEVIPWFNNWTVISHLPFNTIPADTIQKAIFNWSYYSLKKKQVRGLSYIIKKRAPLSFICMEIKLPKISHYYLFDAV